ncbi:hypothetical protein QH639_15825 [Lysinibacillus sp. 1 U-2021]|uniref:hypothetical protein n=1 Tax=Lysinibacillus sp. 1 U-2021 TaxID=3039426 RepID=UPI0024808CD2|nr:hypothetical protein [Lysinibacillus sp. 1 U-2021]WGT37311.1 hypothetical protein QH639_15825 [Lysinibacillus sp. 1 U-2021]
MKKLGIGGLLILVIVIGTVFYQQHQLINDYRALLYNQLYIIQKPIERILLFQETAEKYTQEQRKQLFNPLYDAYTDVANYTGGGLQLEPHIKKEYFMDYLYTKNQYAQSLDAYIEAQTPEQRELAHTQLKEQFEAYKKFLEKTKTELVKVFD